MTEFNLMHLVRDELDSNAEADPAIIAEHVSKRVPTTHLRSALAQCLVSVVRIEAGNARRTATTGISEHDQRRRSRWAEEGALYRRVLMQRIEVRGNWKFLGDCTRDDIMAVVAFRVEQARANMLTAKRYEALADEMDKANAATVGALPDTTVLAVFA